METKKRKRRTKNDIEECIINAATLLIEEKGFQNSTVTAIMQKAKVEPVVFYNRYNDLNSFMDEFVKKYDYWFSDIAKNIENISDSRLQYQSILNTLLDSLKENKMMQQLLRWEISDNNDTTQRTAKLREFHTLPLVDKYKQLFKNSSVEIESVSALIIGGIYYLILHADLSEFAGIDIRSKDGLNKIHRAIEYFSKIFFENLSIDSEAIKIAQKLKIRGINPEIIVECTGLSINLIREL